MKIFFVLCLFPFVAFSLEPGEGDCLQAIQKNLSFIKIKEMCQSVSWNNLDFFSKEGLSPLSYAIKNDNFSLVQYLLKEGMNPYRRNLHWIDSLGIAAIFNASSIIPLLIKEGVSVDSLDDEGNTPLMLAAERGSKKAVLALIKEKALVDHRNIWNENALSLAAREGYLDIIKILYMHKSQIKFFNTRRGGEAPLHEASMNNHLDIVKYFLQKKQNPNLQSLYSKMTPLAYSIYTGSSAVFSYLISQKKVDINLQNARHETPLYIALKMGRKDMMKKLLEKRAKILPKTIDGESVIDLAKNNQDMDSLKILLNFLKSSKEKY